jgi:hypothetical protein
VQRDNAAAVNNIYVTYCHRRTSRCSLTTWMGAVSSCRHPSAVDMSLGTSRRHQLLQQEARLVQQSTGQYYNRAAHQNLPLLLGNSVGFGRYECPRTGDTRSTKPLLVVSRCSNYLVDTSSTYTGYIGSSGGKNNGDSRDEHVHGMACRHVRCPPWQPFSSS